MPDVQKPSIGRIVHYYDPEVKRVFAAIITDTIDEDDELSSGTHVNLTLFASPAFSGDESAEDVPYSETRTKKAHWFWPPRA